jgi:hypothetical protein
MLADYSGSNFFEETGFPHFRGGRPPSYRSSTPEFTNTFRAIMIILCEAPRQAG